VLAEINSTERGQQKTKFQKFELSYFTSKFHKKKKLATFSVGGLAPLNPTTGRCPGPDGGLKRLPDPSPQVVPTFYFIPSYAPASTIKIQLCVLVWCIDFVNFGYHIKTFV